ncbi:SDR family NAD(P)-dependent oxidoreductase [Streptomyces gamaensis]|uniref:SDR family NAD(P)-dependent oxidoreductase n=1 Tax=Streptomyces gamaensis TaxID=1763542 RepID=A0ABW0Z2F1_9ACTN
MKIEGSVALVTGANRGIGRALVAEFLARGAARVHAAARDPHSLEPVIALAPDRVDPMELDLDRPGTITAAAASAPDVTIVVNNAGTHGVGHLLEMDLDVVEKVLMTNCVGPLLVMRAFAHMLQHRGGGAIVNVVSTAAFGATPSQGSYPASKAALHSMTQAVRADLAPYGISVHGVYPGPVDTDMLDYVIGHEPTFGDFPRATPRDVARAVLDGVEAGDEDIFPDPFALEIEAEWRADPKALAARLAAIE